MSALPAGWRTMPLSEAADVTLGQSPPGSSYNVDGVGVPFFQGKAEFTELTAVVRKWTTAGTKFAKSGDILVSMRAPVGPTNLAPTDCSIGRGLASVRARAGLDQRFLLWALRASEQLLASHGTGSTFEAITGKQLKEHPVPVPPLEEQRRIVGVLEDHLSRLDAATAGLLSSRARLSTLRSSVLTDCLRGAVLVGDDIKPLNFGQAILLVPSRWETTTVGAEAELVEYGTGAKTGARQRADDIPVLRMGNVKDGRLDWTNLKYLPADHADFPRLLLQPGDLLFNRTNSAEHVGKSAVFAGEVARASAASYLIRVRFRAGVIPAWANMVINSRYGREFVASVVSQQVGQANVNGTKLKNFPLPLPPLEEQLELVARYEAATAVIDRQILTLDDVTSRSARLRMSLLAAAVGSRLSSEPMEESADV